MSDVDPTPLTPVTLGDRLAWWRGDLKEQLATQHAELLAALAAQHAELLAAIQSSSASGLATEATVAAILAAIGALPTYPAYWTVRSLLARISEVIDTALIESIYTPREPTGGCTEYTAGYAQVSGWTEIIAPETGTTQQWVASWHTAISAPHLVATSLIDASGITLPALQVSGVDSIPACMFGLSSSEIGPLALRYYNLLDYSFMGSTGLNSGAGLYSSGQTMTLYAGRRYVVIADQSYVSNVAPELVIWAKEGIAL